MRQMRRDEPAFFYQMPSLRQNSAMGDSRSASFRRSFERTAFKCTVFERAAQRFIEYSIVSFGCSSRQRRGSDSGQCDAAGRTDNRRQPPAAGL